MTNSPVSSSSANAPARRTFGRRLAIGIGALIALALLTGIALHTPMTRAMLLRWALERARTDAGVRIQIGRLTYNLVALTATVQNVVVTANDSDIPFFHADTVRLNLPWTILTGAIDAESLVIDRPSLVIVRRQDGTLNLPQTGADPNTEPIESIDIERLVVRGLTFRFEDRARNLSLDAAGVEVNMNRDAGGALAGRLSTAGNVILRVRERQTVVTRLDGDLAFDGSILAVDALTLVSPEARVAVDGSVQLLKEIELKNLRLQGALELERIASWASLDHAPSGVLAFSGSANGPLDQLTLDVGVSGDQMAWSDLRNLSLEAHAVVSGRTATVDSLRAGIGAGEVIGEARIAFDDARSRAQLRWQNIDLETLVGTLADLPVHFASVGDGHATLEWSGMDVLLASGSIENRLRAIRAPRNAVGVEGRADLRLEGGRWQLVHDHRVGDATSLSGLAAGRINQETFASTTLDGRLEVRTKMKSVLRELRSAGVGVNADLAARLDGVAFATAGLGGTIGSPTAAGTLGGINLRWGEVGGDASATFSATPSAVTLNSLEASIAENTITGDATFNFDSNTLRGNLIADLRQLGALAAELPEPWRPGGSLRADARLSGAIDNPTVAVELSSDGSRLAGQNVTALRGSVRMANRIVDIERVDVTQDAGRLTASGQYFLSSRRFAFEMAGENLTIAPIPSSAPAKAPFPIDAELDLRLSGSGTLDAPRADGFLEFSRLEWEGYRFGPTHVDVVTPGGAMQLSARIPELNASLQAEVEISEPRSFTADLALIDSSLARIAEPAGPEAPSKGMFPFRPRLAGSVSLRLEASGTSASLTDANATLSVTLDDASVNGAQLRLERPARLRYSKNEIFAEAFELRVGDAVLSARGHLGIDAAAADGLHIHLTGPLSDLVPVARLLPALEEVAASGDIDLTARASGSLKAPRIDAEFALMSASASHGTFPAISDVTLQGGYTDGLLQLRELRAQWQDSTIIASGELPAAILGDRLPAFYRQTLPEPSGRMRATLRIESLTQNALAPFVSEEVLKQIAGRLDVAVALEADALEVEDVDGRITFERAALTLAGVPLSQTQPTRLGLDNGRLELIQWTWGGAGNQIDLAGHALLAGDFPQLDLTATGKIDLRMLGAFFPDMVTEGLAALDVTVTGTTDEPAIDGQLALTGGGLVVRDPRLAITDLEGIVTFAKEELQFRGVTANANGGTVSLAGDLRYPGFELTGGAITVTGRGLAFEIPENLRSEVNAELRIVPKAGVPSLSGEVTVLRGSYREPISLAAQLLTNVETRSVAPAEGGKAGVVDRMSLDVAVSTAEDIIVDNNYGRIEIASDLRIIGTLGEPMPTGRLTIREGGDIFLGGRTYEVVRGTVDFLNRSRLEPTIDLALQTRVQRYDITLDVTGTPETLEANLRSPGLSQTDVVSLLLTGQIAEEGTLVQTEVARSQLLMLLSGELLGFAGRAVGLDSVQISRGLGGAASDFDLLATDTDPSARLTVSKGLSRHVELVFSQSLRETGDITWIAIYRPLNGIEVRGATQDDGSRSYEFRHELEFAGARIEPGGLARPPQPAARIADIRIFGTPGFEERELRDRLRLEEGDPFDFYRWQRDRDRLQRFYRDAAYFEARISARRAAIASTVQQDLRLDYEIRRGPKTTLSIEGHRLPRGVIESMEEVWTWTVFDDFLLEDLETLARRQLMADGYLQASVDAELTASSNESLKEIVVRIAPGTRFDDRRVVFSGHRQSSTESLEEIVEVGGLDAEMWEEPDALKAAIERHYHSQGYLGVSVTVDAPVFNGASAALPVRIDEGPQFTIAGLDIVGAERRADADVRAKFGVEVGSPYMAEMLEPARREVEADYVRDGYNDVRIAVTTLVDDERAQVKVIVRIDEGAQQVLADVAVSGAGITSPGVIARALDLERGEPASVIDLYRSEKRLYDTGVFRTANIAFEPLDENNQNPVQPVRAQVTLSELSPYRFRYGFRLNDDMGPAEAGRETRPALVVDLLRRNVFGRAISAGAAGQIEPNRRLARGVVALPRFLGLPVTTSFFLTSSRQDFTPEGETPFVEDESSVTAEQRFQPTASTSVSYGYTFSRTHVFEPEPVPGLPGLELLARVARLTGTFAWDRRDDPFNARNGWFHSSGLEFGPASLGSDLRFIRYLAQQYYFRPLDAGIGLASGVRIGFGRGFGQDLIRSEKFYGGGGASVRGFAEDGIGGVDFLGDPVGGNSMLILNQELRFPIYKWFRGVTFVDAGNVFATIDAFTLTDLAAGAGVGVRVDSPMGLLRLDLGIPMTDRKRQRAARWYFGIGHAF